MFARIFSVLSDRGVGESGEAIEARAVLNDGKAFCGPCAAEGESTKAEGMKALVESTAFRKDLERAYKRGYDVAKLGAVIRKLQLGEPLPGSIRPRPLKGEWILGVPRRT
jgi:Bacterial toxin of type II toxin-antitoxin system, YafQ